MTKNLFSSFFSPTTGWTPIFQVSNFCTINQQPTDCYWEVIHIHFQCSADIFTSIFRASSQQIHYIEMMTNVDQDFQLSHQCFVLACCGPFCKHKLKSTWNSKKTWSCWALSLLVTFYWNNFYYWMYFMSGWSFSIPLCSASSYSQ